MRIRDYAEETDEQREAVVMCCCRCIVTSPFGAAAVIASRREIDGGGRSGGNHMYRQTRYCCASREKRDMSRVAARVNAVSTSTDQVSAVSSRRWQTQWVPGSRQHDAYMPPPPPRAMINCDVVLYERRSAYFTARLPRPRRAARPGAPS